MVKLVILRALTSKCCESYFHTFVGNKTTKVCFFTVLLIGELPKSSRSFSCSSTVYSKDRGRGTPPCAPIPQEMSPTFTGGQHMHRTGGGPGWTGESDLEMIVENQKMLDFKGKVWGGADLDQTLEFTMNFEDSWTFQWNTLQVQGMPKSLVRNWNTIWRVKWEHNQTELIKWILQVVV